MLIIVALTGCNKDDVNDGKGVGLLNINENEYSLSAVIMRVGGESWPYDSSPVRRISFYNSESKSIVTIQMKDVELTSKTYTNNEDEIFLLGLALNDEPFDIDVENVVMVVNKSDNTYDIIITGKTKSKALAYTVTYQGTIREVQINR